MATATKDMSVENLVEPWRGDSSSIPVSEFFESINEAAEMGRLSSKDKVHLVKLKLKGPARAFYSAQPQLRADDVTFADFRTAFVNRFTDKHTDQYHYARVQNASQEKGESPEVFLDRLRKLCQQTVRNSENPVEQAVINQEADRRLLAAFINGLIGAPGKQVRLQMPEIVDKALNMARVATTAEREERYSARKDRGNNARVFTVGGTRGNTGRDRYRKPRWENSNEAAARGAGFPCRTGQVQYSRRVDGLTLAGLTLGLLRSPRTCGPQEEAPSQGRRPMTIGTRHVGHKVLIVLIAGGRYIFAGIVHEGNEEI
jgi:hypothetical protein